MCARLAHDSADPMAEFHVRCHIIELSRLELGDVTGVIQRMLGQHAQIFSTQEAGLTTLYRQVLSRALCASPDVEAWQAAIGCALKKGRGAQRTKSGTHPGDPRWNFY